MACTYVIKSTETSKFYVGSSKDNDPGTRVLAHNSGKTKSTKFGRPWVLIYSEIYNTYTQARKREIFLKSGQGRELLRELLSAKRRGRIEV